MRWSLIVVVIVAIVGCGAQPAPPAPAYVAAPVVKREGKPRPITCGDVGVILRGHVEDRRAAGPDKEAAIARACLHDKWTEAVIGCVGSAARPRSCLDQLAKEQRLAYQDRLLRWNDEYPDEEVDPEDTPMDDLEELVDCRSAIGDVSRYPPPLALKGKDKELATAMRRMHVVALCEGWSAGARRCFVDNMPIDKCKLLLAADQKQALTDRLAEIDALMAKTIAAQKTPAAIECRKVVAVHYADARWKGKLDGLAPKERKRAIADSRAQMQKACIDDAWSASLRACVIVQGGDQCFTAGGQGVAWGFPASGVAIKTGIAECDAYGDALRALAACTAIPQQAAQTMLETYRRTIAGFANTKPADRTAAATSCKQAASAIRQSAASLGCTI